MGKGHDYELEIVNAINEGTDDSVLAMRPDYSGNSVSAVADVAAVWPQPHAHTDDEIQGVLAELKKRSVEKPERRTNVMSGSKKDQTGREELQELIDGTPPWAEARVGVKFQNRRIIVMDAEALATALDDGEEQTFVGHPRLTPGDNISMYKPTLDVWQSSSASQPDWVTLLEVVGMGAENMPGAP